MVNEIEEFCAYSTFPVYKADNKSDTTYMGRFTLPMLLGFYGFQRILTILAQGFLFADGGDGYERIDYARRALLAWCSVNPRRKKAQKKNPDQDDPGNQVNYAEYHAEFPDLVDEDGNGWLIRHVDNIVRFMKANPTLVRKDAAKKLETLEDYRGNWVKWFDHIQAVPFSDNTKGKWGLRIEDVLADALLLGPLKDRDFELPESMLRRLTELTPKGVPAEVSILLCKYYVIGREQFFATCPEYADTGDPYPFIVLPNQACNAYFGCTTFSQKWTSALNGLVMEKKAIEGVCKYRINPELLELLSQASEAHPADIE